MAAVGTVYTEATIKNLVMTQVGQIMKVDPPFSPEDADVAYQTAVRECGYIVPTSDDEDLDQRNHWLIERMRRWFIWNLVERHALFVSMGDVRTSSIPEQVMKIIKVLDDAFQAAKSDTTTAHLFIDAEVFFGSPIVVASQFVDDRVGQDQTTYAEL